MKTPTKTQKFLQGPMGSYTPTALPSNKWSTFIDINKTNIKFTQQQCSPIKVKKYEKNKTHLKCYQKPHRKITGESLKQKIQSIKQVTFNQREQNQFIISSADKNFRDKRQETDEDNERNRLISFHSPCMGLINPMYINVKSNPKRLTYSCQLPKGKELTETEIHQPKFPRNSSALHQTKNKSKTNRSQQNKQLKNSQNLYFRIVSQMNDYFSSMKLASFKNNKAEFLSKRNIRAQSQKKNLQEQKMSEQMYKKQRIKSQTEEKNLNIVGLRPKTSDYQRIDRKLIQNYQIKRTDSLKRSQKQNIFSSKFYESQKYTSIAVEKQLPRNQFQQKKYEFNLGDDINSVVISNEIFSPSPLNNYRKEKIRSNIRPMTQQIKRPSPQKGVKKVIFKGYCFGEFSSAKQSQQEIYRLKVLYYKDLLWKNSWNLCIKYVPSNEGLRYYVGKGNNSKLIKNLMAKRWWWSLESKEENSQFIWTQLKIYSIYQKQPCLSIQKEISEDQLEVRIESPCRKRNEDNKEQKYLFMDNSSIILSPQNKSRWQSYISQSQNIQRQKKITQQTIELRRKPLISTKIPCLPSPQKLTNHLEYSRAIGNKKALYKVMMTYFNLIRKYQIDEIYVPLTYHITAGLEDEEYLRFLSEYYRRNKAQGKTCWIVKPGELTNRGNGIRYCKDLAEIKPIVKKKQAHPNGTLKTFLIQSYIDRPFLYRGRKFDIRHYIMISCINGKLRGYFYQGGYIRTTSYRYRLDDTSPAVHLTNDAVQKYCKDYGRFQKGNKLSYQQFDEYMKQKYTFQNGDKSIDEDKYNSKRISFFDTIMPQIRQISTDVIHAAYYFVDPSRRLSNFEIFGLDIMIDEQLKCYLIEVNTNPCLELSSPVLRNVIPEMLDNALALTLDCCYPPPEKESLSQYNKKYKYPQSYQNKFEIVFDEDVHGSQIKRIYQSQGILKNQISGIGDDDENFQSCDENDNDDY